MILRDLYKIILKIAPAHFLMFFHIFELITSLREMNGVYK